MDFAEALDKEVARAVVEVGEAAAETEVETVPNGRFIASETIGEVIEKLLILHIRTWHLEDLAQRTETMNEPIYAETRRKIEHCCGTKRPRLLVALNAMFKALVAGGQTDLVEDYPIKQYGDN